MSNERHPNLTVAASLAVQRPAAAKTNVTAPARRPGALEMPLLLAVVSAVLVFAWTRRNEGDLTAETGVGYYLGIAGGLMMLVLLAYPLRKRLRALRFMGSIPGWFRVHMLLGVLGPTLIVLHSNFTLGSTNSRTALFAMLVVVGSGFIGRFLYAHVYRGLYGHQQMACDRFGEVEELRGILCRTAASENAALQDDLVAILSRYQASRLEKTKGFWRALVYALTGPISRARLRARLLRNFQREVSEDGSDTFRRKRQFFLGALDRYFYSVGKAEALAFYERSFAAWHLLHVPLFIILILSTIAHIIAVHLY